MCSDNLIYFFLLLFPLIDIISILFIMVIVSDVDASAKTTIIRLIRKTWCRRIHEQRAGLNEKFSWNFHHLFNHSFYSYFLYHSTRVIDIMNPIKLASKDLIPRGATPSPSAKGHLCIAHGLLGNAMNWGTAARYLAAHPLLKDHLASLYSLDLRNHGNSPHAPNHTNAVLSSDVEKFLMERINKDLPFSARQVLIGHSMGGLTMMGMLLRRFNESALLPVHPEEAAAVDGPSPLFPGWDTPQQRDLRTAMRLVNKDLGFSETYPLRQSLFWEGSLQDNRDVNTNGAVTAAVIVDVTPTVSLGSDVRDTLKGLCQVDLSKVYSYNDAQEELIRVGMDDKNMRDFFTTNIIIKKTEPARWRCNLHVLAQHVDLLYPPITEWFLSYKKNPKGLEPSPCTLPVLFVFGENSVYNVPENRDIISLFFPNSQQVVVNGAGHFVHHEKPKEFVDLVAPFIRQYIE